MVGVQGTSDPNPQLLDAMAMCGHLVARDSVHWFLAEHRQRLFPDDMFADLFGVGSGPPVGAGRCDRHGDGAAGAGGFVGSRRDRASCGLNIAWKVAAGRPLHDEGFHPTVLTLWRNKLRAQDRPQRIFDAVREVIDATNILAGKTRRALDSTVLDDAVTRQDAIMQLVAQIRRVRRLIPAAKALTLVAHDYDNDPGKPACAWNDRADIDRVVTELVNDAHTILAALDGVELDDAQAEAVGLLALVAGQDVEPGDTDGTWRIAPVTRPDRMVSVHDPESRHVHKTTSQLPRRVQSPHRGRTRHRADHRLRADRRQRRRRPSRTRPARRRDRTGRGARRLRLRLRRVPRTTSPTTATPRRSNRSRCTPRSPTGSPSTTSRSTSTAMTATCPNGITVHDQPPGLAKPASVAAATAARCVNAAPAPPPARSSPSTNTTTCSPPPAPTPSPPRSSSPTGSTARWSNAPSPGSSDAAAAKSATAASPATASDSPTAAPRSTCAASSTSASHWDNGWQLAT